MRGQVLAELRKIEQAHSVEIVSARRHGSAMYGVDHNDSDHDVRFIFKQQPHEYATLDGHTESIVEHHLGGSDDIDVHGWNVDKFVELLADTDPNAIEYCLSEATEYIKHDGLDAIEEELHSSFPHMSLYYRYMGMAKSNYEEYIKSGKECTKGRQFYIARALACASHIREAGELPPMNAFDLYQEGEMNDKLAGALFRMSVAKSEGEGDHPTDDKVGDLYEAEAEAPMTVTDERTTDLDRGVLDDFIEGVIA